MAVKDVQHPGIWGNCFEAESPESESGKTTSHGKNKSKKDNAQAALA